MLTPTRQQNEPKATRNSSRKEAGSRVYLDTNKIINTMSPPFITSVARAAVTAAFAVSSSSSSSLRRPQSRTSNLETPSLLTFSSTVVDLAEMCRVFGIVGPRGSLESSINSCLCLTISSSNDSRRGLYYFGLPTIQQGDVILSIPLTSCLRDDNPPSWYYGTANYDADRFDDIIEEEEDSSTAWFTRLGAQVLDILIDPSATTSPSSCCWEMWHNSLPNSNILRSTLPVHWSSTAIAHTQCTDIDIMVDAQYFVREAAISRLIKKRYNPAVTAEEEEDDDGVIKQQQLLTRKCHDALDIVQTRSCRVERKLFGGGDDGDDDDNVPPRVWGPPIRIIAPVFDFINHGGSGSGSNACFGVEDNINGNNNNNNILLDDSSRWLVVRATRTINKGDEILIDYGDSARPQWKCLTSYGFVPSSTVNYKEEEVNDNTDNEAELWMHGRQFMVNALSVPYELVEVATAQAVLDDEINVLDDNNKINSNYDDDEVSLAPSILLAIAKRAKETAYNLILESTTEITNDDNQEKVVWDTPDFIRAMSLASELRWSQHVVLLAFADNLISYLNMTTSSS